MKKRALLIGINEYPLVGNLSYARQDAEAVYFSLLRYYGFTEDELFLMTENERAEHRPTQRFIERQLRHIRDAYRDLDFLLVGFWGHGLLAKADKRYLCASDTDAEEIETTGISFELLWDHLTSAGAQNMCLILDCCQNRAAGRGTMETFTEAESVYLSTGVAKVARDVLARKRARGEHVTIPPTYAIMNSCSPGQRAYEWEVRQHGIFTAHLLEGMSQGLSSIGQLARYVSEQVPQTSQRVLYQDQTPFFKLEGSGDIELQLKESSIPLPKKTPSTFRMPTVPSLEEESEQIYRELKAEEERKQREAKAKKLAMERLARERGEGIKAGESKKGTHKGVKYTFRWCPPGTFMMGSPDNERQHEVTLTRGFWMLETPVTQEMWESVMGNNPSYFKGPKRPVENVSWDDCQQFITKLNKNSKGMNFRLPSEAEWEYACRAGTSMPYNFGGKLNGDKANCNGNFPYGTTEKGKYLERTSVVKSYSPNAWGLYDMHGNVWEWCQDRYGDYPSGSVTDPTGPDSGSSRVPRGGGWSDSAGDCRSACRSRSDPGCRSNSLGFRLALVPSE